MSYLHETLKKWLPLEVVIFIKFQEDRTENVDFLLVANFIMRLIFFSSDFSMKSKISNWSKYVAMKLFLSFYRVGTITRKNSAIHYIKLLVCVWLKAIFGMQDHSNHQFTQKPISSIWGLKIFLRVLFRWIEFDFVAKNILDTKPLLILFSYFQESSKYWEITTLLRNFQKKLSFKKLRIIFVSKHTVMGLIDYDDFLIDQWIIFPLTFPTEKSVGMINVFLKIHRYTLRFLQS